MENLLLLHGAIGSKNQFVELSKSLQNDFNVYSFNFTGHGGEPMPDEPFSIELFANDVLDWMSKNNFTLINIFGYSMGGYVGMYLAKHHPEKINKLFTVATKYEWNKSISEREIKLLNAEKIENKIPAFAKLLADRHTSENWKIVLNKTAEMLQKMGIDNPLNSDDYLAIEIPVTVAVGDRDSTVSIDETTAVYRKLENARLLILPNVKHPFEDIPLTRLSFEIKSFFHEK